MRFYLYTHNIVIYVCICIISMNSHKNLMQYVFYVCSPCLGKETKAYRGEVTCPRSRSL